MSNYRLPTRKTGTLEAAAEIGVKWPKALKDALTALAIATEHDRQARAIAAVGRVHLETEWLARKAEHDAAEAAAKAPEDFEPFAEARPDVGALQDLAAIYDRNRRLAQRDVDAAASEYAKLYALLDAAWRKLPSVVADSMTVTEAAGVDAGRAAGRVILRAANLAIAKAAGLNEDERKALRRAAQKEPGRLPNLHKLRAKANGQSDDAVKRAATAKAKADTEKAAVKASAHLAAKARMGGGTEKVGASA